MEQADTTQSPLSKKTLQNFRELLLKKRHEAEEEVDALEQSLKNLTDAEAADHSSSDHHMGDFGSDVEEEELKYQLLERTKKYIGQIDDALARIEDGTYGICQATGKPIAKERLKSVPHTRYSIEAKKNGLVEDL